MSKKILLAGIVMVMIIWGISWPSSKILTRYATALEISAIRFVFNTLTVLVILLIAEIPLNIAKQAIPKLVVAATLLVVYNLFFFKGIQLGLPGKGGILVTTITPIVTYALSLIISRRALLREEILGLFLGLLAGILQLKLWQLGMAVFAGGNLFFLGCTITWAFLSRITAKAASYGNSLSFTFWMYIGCTIGLLCLVDVPKCWQVVKNGDFLFWLNLLFNTVINAGSATVFYFYATTILGAERTSSFTFLVPFSAAISSFLIFAETIPWHTFIGGLVGIVAVYMLNRQSVKKAIKPKMLNEN